MAREHRVLPYIDMPIQHGSDAVLARMRRPERAHTIRSRVAQLRDAVPDAAIRTTCIVGFPGETDDDFARLCDLLEDVRFERVGAFTYSPQEGTRAAALPDDVPMAVKHDRLERLTDLQRAITAERLERHVGRVARAIVDRVDGGVAEGRVVWQADEIDGITRFEGSGAVPGSVVDCELEAVVDDDDFSARLVRVVHAAPDLGRLSRQLPVMRQAASASYGR
jgi:ribosomal protein S12 methylthiotransferase